MSPSTTADGLVGRKCGMTRIFTDAGVTVPVTVVEALPNRISQVKDAKSDGYRAVQVTIGARRPSRVTKAQAGHFAKANVAAGSSSKEFRLGKGEGVPCRSTDAGCRTGGTSARIADRTRKALLSPCSPWLLPVGR